MLGPDPNKEPLKDSIRLTAFLQECLLLGTLRGFKHFETFLRGKEELILCIFTAQHHKSDRNSATLMPFSSEAQQKSSSKMQPWTSPKLISLLDKDLRKETDRVVFLVAGYTKYQCPYVWLRSFQDQLIQNQQRQDNPLFLSKTIDWKTQNVSLWEIVAELVLITTNPKNPFEIDFDYIDSLPVEETVLLTSALLSFLETVWIEASPDYIFIDKVQIRRLCL
ncbi:MAG: hypothetical protein EXX96DRAFT_622731 [Benjaminiella poitrasii]|nr:MAG: hypothetical protein EXX96DRAFT_622731 [Benjaminiella poitrasii]